MFFASKSPSSSLLIFLLLHLSCGSEYFKIFSVQYLAQFLLSLTSVVSNILFVLCLAPSWSFKRYLLIIVLLFEPCRNWRALPPKPCPAPVFITVFGFIVIFVKSICLVPQPLSPPCPLVSPDSACHNSILSIMATFRI